MAGETLGSFTVMENVSESLRLGEPSSVTVTVTEKTPGPWDSLGVQLNRPVNGSMLAPLGAPGSKLKVNTLAGTSLSLAVAVNDNGLPSSTT